MIEVSWLEEFFRGHNTSPSNKRSRTCLPRCRLASLLSWRPDDPQPIDLGGDAAGVLDAALRQADTAYWYHEQNRKQEPMPHRFGLPVLLRTRVDEP
jgi:hypothetical protein